MTPTPNQLETATYYRQSLFSKPQKIAIIGCGYVGTALSCYWHQEQGYSVTATTTRQERVTELEKVATEVVVMRGEDSQAMEALVQDRDTVILSVAPMSDRQFDAELYRKTYIPTAQNLVAALQKTPKVKQVLYLSSCSIYGNKQGDWVDENSPVDSSNEYNQILSETEQLLLNSESENTKVSILRLGGIYGSKRELNKRLTKFAGKTMPGSREALLCWVHLDDIIAAIDFLAQRRLAGIYNVVNDLSLTIGELCDFVCDIQGLERVIWDDTQPSYRLLNARVSNQKIKAAGYNLIHPEMIV